MSNTLDRIGPIYVDANSLKYKAKNPIWAYNSIHT